MADLYGSISRIALPKIGQEPAQEAGLRTWFTRGTYRFNEEATNLEFVLSGLALSEIVPFFSFDYERFALSSFESFDAVTRELPPASSTGWSLLKMYYSAFFACHAIMRVCGEAVIRVEREQAEVLQAAADPMLKIPQKIEPGMFSFALYQKAPGIIEAKLTKLSGKNGAHEGFWIAFDEFLTRRSNQAIEARDPDASTFIAGVNELQPLFRPYKRRRSSWLSAVRNEINYQHEHGVWEPRSIDRKTLAVVVGISERASSSVRLDYSKDKEDIAAFAMASNYFSTLNIEVANVIAANSTKNRSFGQKWRRLRDA